MRGRRNRIPLTIGFIVVCFAILIGYKLWQGAPEAQPEVVGSILPASAQVTPLMGGDARPLSDEIVGVTVVNLFASWCAPCRAENPVLLELRSEGLRIVGIAIRDEPAATQAFLDELGDPYFRVMSDRSGSLAGALSIGSELPQTLVISPSGEILYRHSGPLAGTDGEAALEEIRELAGPR